MRKLTTTFLFIALTCYSFSQLKMRELRNLRDPDTKKELDYIVCFNYSSEDDSIRYSKFRYWKSVNNMIDDRIYTYSWTDNRWYPSSLLETISNPEGYITKEVLKIGHSTSWWKDDEKYEYTYDAKNRATSMIYSIYYPGIGYKNLRREDYVYTETGDSYENKTIKYYLNSQTEEWIATTQILTVRNRDSLLKYSYSLKWDETKTSWDSTKFQLYDYPNLNEKVHTTMIRDEKGMDWIPRSKLHYFYCSKDKIEKKLYHKWDTDKKEWELAGKHDYQYYREKMIFYSDSSWNVEGTVPVLEDVLRNEKTFIKEGVIDSSTQYKWNPITKELYSIALETFEWDDNYNMIKTTLFQRNDPAASWDTTKMRLYAYNDVKQPILETYYSFFNNVRRGKYCKKYEYNENGDLNFYDEHTWDEATWEWNLFKRHFYYYKEPVVTLNTYISEPLIKIYPNPAQDYLHITNLEGQNTISVTMLNGIEILKKKNVEKLLSINLSGYVPGIYIVRIENENEVFIQKVLKQ